VSEYVDIQVVVDDPCCVITLNRPETLNAFTYQTLRELRHAIDAAVIDERVVGIVITGAGRGFSSGLDAQVLAAATASGESTSAESTADELPGLFSYLLEVPKPVIAAINGVAAGGGLVLALMSDLRIASTAASFVTVFLKRGLIAEHGSSWLLPRLVGTGRALDLLWLSERIDATTAAQIGLVERLVAPEDLLDTARDYIQRLSEASSPKAIAATKRLVYDHLGVGYATALIEADAVQKQFVAAPDAAEGARALIEKRPARFSRLGSAALKSPPEKPSRKETP
jgi:enoyl-CoA hydratase/carnithine racemase